jgi:hypothetical protein
LTFSKIYPNRPVLSTTDLGEGMQGSVDPLQMMDTVEEQLTMYHKLAGLTHKWLFCSETVP